MTTLSIDLPDPLRAFAERKAAELGLATVGDYLARLVRDQQKAEAKAKLEALLLASLESGPPIEVTEEYKAEKIRLLERQTREEVGR